MNREFWIVGNFNWNRSGILSIFVDNLLQEFAKNLSLEFILGIYFPAIQFTFFLFLFIFFYLMKFFFEKWTDVWRHLCFSERRANRWHPVDRSLVLERRIPGSELFAQMSLFLMHSGSFKEIRGTVRFFVNSTQLAEFVFVPCHVSTQRGMRKM